MKLQISQETGQHKKIKALGTKSQGFVILNFLCFAHIAAII